MADRGSGQQSRHREVLHGWGRTSPVGCDVAALERASVGELVRSAGERGVLARGLGRSYGDAAQNSGGLVLLGRESGVTVAEDRQSVDALAGTSLHELMEVLLPQGLFLPVTPGTRQVTVGGAIASDVHGKNHYRAGSFADHVLSLDLVGADGTTRTITPQDDPEHFWATAGGMGLTGVVTRASLRVRPVGSAYLTTTTQRAASLEDLLGRFPAATDRHEHTAAWVDLRTTGRALGRSILQSGDHAEADDLQGAAADDPFRAPVRPRWRVPVATPTSVVNRATVRAFNEAWFRKAPSHQVDSVEHLSAFFHPLDAIDGWNRLYGPRGLVQYQLAVPDGAEESLSRAVRLVADSGTAPFLGVLKRLGSSNDGWLSFPLRGWTLAVDFPAGAGLAPLFRALDEVVVEAGGRVYLTKDATARPETVRRMYPRADAFRGWRRSEGLDRVFCSDLARRLDL